MNPSDKPPVPDGWNDPPANIPLSESMSTKRVLLNKRVAYTNQTLGPISNQGMMIERCTPPRNRTEGFSSNCSHCTAERGSNSSVGCRSIRVDSIIEPDLIDARRDERYF